MNKRQQFEEWLVGMDDKLDLLRDEVPKEVADKMDYSPESLSALERWLLSAYGSVDKVVQSDKYLLDRLSCYVGETFRKNTGGIWTIDYSDQDSVYYGLPVLQREGKAPRCPLSVLTASLDRHTGSYMEGIIRKMIGN
jgi:hypothetical protein